MSETGWHCLQANGHFESRSTEVDGRYCQETGVFGTWFRWLGSLEFGRGNKFARFGVFLEECYFSILFSVGKS